VIFILLHCLLNFDAASLDMFSFQLVFILDATKKNALNYGWVIVGGAHSLLIGLLFFQLIILTLGLVPIFFGSPNCLPNRLYRNQRSITKKAEGIQVE
jgi:hypothetical protein